MKISAMDYSFRRALRTGELDAAGVIRYLKELDVPAVELSDMFVREQDLDAIRTVLDETGSEVGSYVTYCDLVNPDASERQSQVSHIKKNLELAAALGAPCALVLPGDSKSDVSADTARGWISEGLRDCIPDASRLGITLTMENLGSDPTLYGRSEHLQSICEAVGPEMKVTYDVGNFVILGEDPLQALERLAPRLMHVHFKDWHVLPEGETPDPSVEGCYPGADGRYYDGAVLGEGVVDLKGPLTRLRELRYGGCVSVEYEGRGEPREAIRKGVVHLRSLLEGGS